MKAFVSYSVSGNNEFVLTLLSAKLRANNFIITTSQNFYSDTIDHNTKSEISSSHLFVGIITGNGEEKKRVLDEWKYAIKRNIPNLLLIENTVLLNDKFRGNYIKFDRNNPQKAIREINAKMANQKSLAEKGSDNLVAWLLGGAALLAIISLLTNKES